MITFLLKSLAYFVVFFMLLSIPVGDQTVFDSLYGLVNPYTGQFFEKEKTATTQKEIYEPKTDETPLEEHHIKQPKAVYKAPNQTKKMLPGENETAGVVSQKEKNEVIKEKEVVVKEQKPKDFYSKKETEKLENIIKNAPH